MSINPPNLANGLVGWWTFDGKYMINNVTDSSGQGNNGDLVGATTTVPGVFGQALQFNGTNQYVDIPTNASLNAYPITITAWFKSAIFTGNFTGIVNKYSATSLNGWQIFTQSGNSALCAWYFSNTGANTDYDNSPCAANITGYADGKWHQVIFVVNSLGSALYVDGALKNADGWTGSPGATDTSADVNIGRYQSASGNPYFGGTIDDVRVYNRALSATEITQLYNLGTATHQNVTINPPNLNTGLVGHWTFDGKDMVNNGTDSSGQGNNGDLEGGATTTVPGVSGQALSFDGSTQYVNIPSTTGFGNNYATFTAWIYSNANQPTYSSIISSNDGSEIGLRVSGSGTNQITAGWSNIGGEYDASTGLVIPNGKWTFVAGVINPTNITVYMNASSFVITQTNNSRSLAGQVWFIGKDSSPGRFWNGAIDDVRIYNRALSPQEIAQLYNLSH